MPRRDRRPGPTPGGRDASRAAAASQMLSYFTGGVEQGSRRDIIARLGGTTAAARVTGMSARQMRRWASGETRRPRNSTALRAMNRADAIERMRGAGTRLGDDGTPTDPSFIRASGHVRVNGDTDTPTYAYDREIGSQGYDAGDPGLRLDDETIGYVVDAVSEEDDGNVQFAIESDLSRNVVGVRHDPSARDGEGVGMFIDRLDQFEVRQQPSRFWET